MSDSKINEYAILLAGGTGTRLWPVSRELYPKQLVKFIGEDSLLQSTIKRLTPVINEKRIRIVCGKEHFHETAKNMAEIGVQPERMIISEPCGRNTAPAILLAVLHILKIEPDAVLAVFPADHVIRAMDRFHANLEKAIQLAGMGHIVTFGIKPYYPETGYGYIEGEEEIYSTGVKDKFDEALSVKRFVEKPDRETAETYVKAGNFFWNSGMFAFKASVIVEEFRSFMPELLEKMKNMLEEKDLITKKEYEELPNISIDYAIMEKTSKGVVLPSDFEWSDIGSWKSLYDFLPKDHNNNVLKGDVLAKDTENCLIFGHGRLITTNHLKNKVVVETPDSVFVSDMDNSREVKSIVEELKKKGRIEYHEHRTVYHVWGNSTLLEDKDDLKVVRLFIYPGSVFQVKTGDTTVKHLIVTNGRAIIKSEKQSLVLKKGETYIISKHDSVILENPGREFLNIMQIEMGNG